MILNIENVSKQYSKDKLGLKNFSLKIENGILGLLGPNGAGKSTLMRIIASISSPTSGTVTVDGIDITKDPNYIRKFLVYLPQDFGVYPNLNAYEFLEYIAAMKGIGGTHLKERIAQLLESVNLIDAAKRPIGTYSGGMKQRVGIAQVLLNDPRILIFDEPTVGLDPEERVRFRNLISDLANDCIVILSSHIVSDIETIADKIAIMKGGQLVSQGYPDEIIDAIKDRVFEVELENDAVKAFKEKYLILDTNKKKIGLMGHSEGGIIAPMVASKSKDIAFIALLAGPGLPGDELLILQLQLLGKASGQTETEYGKAAEFNKGAFDIIKKSSDQEQLKTDLTAYLKKSLKESPNGQKPEGMSDEELVKIISGQIASPWMQYFLKYNPAAVLEKVKCPVLAINGDKDLQVPSKQNLPAIKAALLKGGNKNVTTIELPGMNHLFQECKTGFTDEYGTIEQTFSPIALAEILKWVKTVAK